MSYQVKYGVWFSAILCCVSISMTGCSSQDGLDPEKENIEYVFEGRPATPPAGVVRYCWEEPIVAYEPNGPGVDAEGRWYHPSYIAVREIRQGRWRPCSELADEIKGETTNER